MSKRKKNSAQQLMGIEDITDYSIVTRQGELVFFVISPTNLSVLPESGISARINALLNVIRTNDGLELMASDAMQSFEFNKHFYRGRLEKEPLPAPTFTVDPDITDFYAFTKNSFRIDGYQYHPFDFEIPMAI